TNSAGNSTPLAPKDVPSSSKPIVIRRMRPLFASPTSRSNMASRQSRWRRWPPNDSRNCAVAADIQLGSAPPPRPHSDRFFDCLDHLTRGLFLHFPDRLSAHGGVATRTGASQPDFAG